MRCCRSPPTRDPGPLRSRPRRPRLATPDPTVPAAHHIPLGSARSSPSHRDRAEGAPRRRCVPHARWRHIYQSRGARARRHRRGLCPVCSAKTRRAGRRHAGHQCSGGAARKRHLQRLLGGPHIRASGRRDFALRTPLPSGSKRRTEARPVR